ncbi:MAG: PHP domain-containing protein [Butyricicoccus sp.]|nr:PHP domain-containing protein [Butyricicoccus sp.]
MEIKLDLHIHSERSPDGRMSVAEIVSLARARGLDGAAICDHDAVLTDAPEFEDFLVIPGVEVSTQLGHLLGLFVTTPVETRDFFEAVELIHAQGGLAVLAHPFEHSRDGQRLTPAVPMLDGVEVQNSRAERKIRDANALARAFAEKHALRQFGGSDAHCSAEVGNSFTVVDAPELTPEAVKAALLAGNAAARGHASRAWYVARSQLTRRRKTGASPAAYAKWAAFAAKCCIQDIFRRGE